MNDKTRNKLNHILEAVPMSREHKSMLVEVFDEVSNGGGGSQSEEKIVLTVDVDNQKVQFLDVEYTSTFNFKTTEGGFNICEISNAELNRLILDYYKNNPINHINVFWGGVDVNCTVLTYQVNPDFNLQTFIVFLEGPVGIEFIN